MELTDFLRQIKETLFLFIFTYFHFDLEIMSKVNEILDSIINQIDIR